jgi:hypothetical protein
MSYPRRRWRSLLAIGAATVVGGAGSCSPPSPSGGASEVDAGGGSGSIDGGAGGQVDAGGAGGVAEAAVADGEALSFQQGGCGSPVAALPCATALVALTPCAIVVPGGATGIICGYSGEATVSCVSGTGPVCYPTNSGSGYSCGPPGVQPCEAYGACSSDAQCTEVLGVDTTSWSCCSSAACKNCDLRVACSSNCSAASDCPNASWSCAQALGAPGTVCVCELTNGGVEICDGIDDDCDGIVDDEPASDQSCSGKVPGATCQQGSCCKGALCGLVNCGDDCRKLATPCAGTCAQAEQTCEAECDASVACLEACESTEATCDGDCVNACEMCTSDEACLDKAGCAAAAP